MIYELYHRTVASRGIRELCLHLKRKHNQRLHKMFKSVALQSRRAKTDWSGCCQMAVQGTLWLTKRLSLNINFSFLTGFRYFSYQGSYLIVLTRLGGPRSRPYTSRKISIFTRESNPIPLDGSQTYIKY